MRNTNQKRPVARCEMVDIHNRFALLSNRFYQTTNRPIAARSVNQLQKISQNQIREIEKAVELGARLLQASPPQRNFRSKICVLPPVFSVS